MDLRIDTIRQGRNAARVLRERARQGGLSTEELELLLGKIDEGLETALDVEQLRGRPVDFPETVARLAAEGLKVTSASLLPVTKVEPPKSVLDWSAPETPGTPEAPIEAAVARLRRRIAEVFRTDPLPPFGNAPNRMRTVRGLGVIDGDRT